jgi:ATP-dependent protease ClpP protease subunit
MEKIKAQITNNNLDGFSEIRIIGDISGYDGRYLASQIDNLTDNEYKPTKNLRIRINSYGGDVLRGGFSIVSAMQRFMNAGGTIETFNEGCADSTAGWIAACGTRGKRKVMQFSSGFFHAPMFEDGRTIEDLPEGSEERRILEDNFEKLVNIFVSATGKPASRIKQLMKNETELSADELVREGFADELVEVDNIPKIKNGISRMQIVNITDGIDFKIKQKQPLAEGINTINMKLTTILNLKPEASEGAIEAAVTEIINANKKAVKDLEKANTELVNAKAELEKFKKAQKEKEDQEIVNYVDKLIELDARKKDQRESLINMAKSDFETFKNVMPQTKAVIDGKPIDEGADEEPEGDGKDSKAKGIENAKKFSEMSHAKRLELKNENLSEYSELARDYDKYFSEIK